MASTTWARQTINQHHNSNFQQETESKYSSTSCLSNHVFCQRIHSEECRSKGLLLTVPGAKMNEILENLPSWLDKHVSVKILVVLLAQIMFHSSIRSFLDGTLCIYKTSSNSANRKVSFIILLPQLVVVSLNFNIF